MAPKFEGTAPQDHRPLMCRPSRRSLREWDIRPAELGLGGYDKKERVLLFKE